MRHREADGKETAAAGCEMAKASGLSPAKPAPQFLSSERKKKLAGATGRFGSHGLVKRRLGLRARPLERGGGQFLGTAALAPSALWWGV